MLQPNISIGRVTNINLYSLKRMKKKVRIRGIIFDEGGNEIVSISSK